jgi:hypothetical protein
MHFRARLPRLICAQSSQIGIIGAITSEVGLAAPLAFPLAALARLLHVGSR